MESDNSQESIRDTRCRLKAERERMRRAAETDEQRSARRLANTERNRFRRANYTSDEANQRTEAERIRQRSRIANHTPDVIEQSRAAHRVCQAEYITRQRLSIANHTPDVIEQRREAHRVCQAEYITRQRANTMRHAFALQQVLVEDELNEHSCGNLDQICEFCGARHFVQERPPDKKFTHCCHKGTVVIPTRGVYPQMMQNLISNPDYPGSENFLNNIRSYNSSVAFASMGANIVTPPGHGPYCFRVNGTVYHITSHLHPGDGEHPKYAQLYVIDPSTAVGLRMQLPENHGCDAQIMASLDALIRRINPYAKAYRMLHELEKEEKESAFRENRQPHYVTMKLHSDRELDNRRYNLPTNNEVAMVFVHADGEPPFDRDIRIYPRAPKTGSKFVQINILNENLDPMTYPIFYPNGEQGWKTGIALNNRSGRNSLRKNVTMLQFKQYQMAIRETFNPILHGGKLFQQWIVDSHLQVEANNLNYVRQQQKKLRIEQYNGLMDYVLEQAVAGGIPVGKTLILPSSFQGSPRNMRERYQDAMAIVCRFGKPDILLTFTCNPNWPEIRNNLKRGQQPSDRPDLVARVFNLKLNSMLEDITKKHVLGKVLAYVYVIEFQKRGLPHAHMLLIFEEEDKPREADHVDMIVSAEIPNQNTNPRLYEIVTCCLIHGPCGAINRSSPCMAENGCSKGFPKKFQETTNVNVDGYPLYRRRELPSILIHGKPVDNRWVVPYNPWLTLKYNAHINLEICTSMKVVKYLFKYIFKGYDCATVDLRQKNEFNHDEIQQYLDARYVSAPEAAWRLFENNMHGRSHGIIRLAVHLANEQTVSFLPGHEAEALSRNTDTTLTAWFRLNREDPNARQYLYSDIPYHYVYVQRKWKIRQRGGNNVISRMYTVSPRDKERFYLRLLLLHTPGATSFEFLRTVDYVVHSSFHEAAKARHLLQDDQEWDNTLNDATVTAMPSQIRKLFAYILTFCSPSDPLELWMKHRSAMIEDYARTNDQECSEQLALHDLQDILSFHGLTCRSCGLPELKKIDRVVRAPYIPEDEWNKYLEMSSTFNDLQRSAFETLTHAIESTEPVAKAYYLDGPGGSGKTYLYTTLIHWIRGKKGVVLSHATTGIAAVLLPEGKTAHSGFKLPVPLLDTSTSSMRPRSEQARCLREAQLLIIDEASMLQNHGLRCIDLLLREIMCEDDGTPSKVAFGGKLLLLGGDFRQTLPVVPRGTKAEVLEACLKNSPLWYQFVQLQLVTNMRTGGVENEFNKWLLGIGDGTLGNDAGLGEDFIEIPSKMVEEGDLIRSIFGDNMNPNNIHNLAKRVILATKNTDTLLLNSKIMELLPGEYKNYFSADSIVSDDPTEQTRFPIEFLHRQTPSGMPQHHLALKIGAIVMFLRNLSKNLCNGTRLIVKGLHERFVDLEVLTGKEAGDRVILPRIDLAPTDSGLPFILKRRQFPIRVSFAMTVNKSQGQSFDAVGLYLPEPVFGHGQLYVGLSRGRSPENIKILLRDRFDQGNLLGDGRYFTKNVVYKEVLQTTLILDQVLQPVTTARTNDHDFEYDIDEQLLQQMHLDLNEDEIAQANLQGVEFEPSDEDLDWNEAAAYTIRDDEDIAHRNLQGVEFEPPPDEEMYWYTTRDFFTIHGDRNQ